jgi:hypothetical protein
MAEHQPGVTGPDEGLKELDEPRKLAHELLNTLFATDMLLERALEHEELGTDPMDDVRRAREGVKESLDVIKRRLER